MAFNRIADYTYDRKNPRTAGRPLQVGKISLAEAWVFTAVMIVVFVVSAAMLNRLAFILSFPVLAILFGCSYTKRVTFLSHWVLGASLGLSPLAVWVAVRSEISLVSLLLGGGVTFWVAGFDIIYATQDFQFDRRERLSSLPAKIGVTGALVVSGLCHVMTVLMFLWAGIAAGMGLCYYAGLSLITACLFYEHAIVRKHGLTRVNEAFFVVNGVVSVLFCLFTAADILIRRGYS